MNGSLPKMLCEFWNKLHNLFRKKMMSQPASKPPGPTYLTNGVVRRMFVATADQNYATARWAFLNSQDMDFLWLGLHALEKYFKAILLMNGRSAKGYGHNIVRLHKDVLKLDPTLSFGPLVKPVQAANEAWRDESMEAFIERLNNYGDANNRYMLYGYVIGTADLLKLDQLVYAVRRHCRPLRQTLPVSNGPPREINWVEVLEAQPGRWKLAGDSLIEKAASGKVTKDLERALFDLNFAFAPGYAHSDARIRHAAANPPLADWFDRLKSDQASPETRQAANDTLRWVLDNIQLTKPDKNILKDALETLERIPITRARSLRR